MFYPYNRTSNVTLEHTYYLIDNSLYFNHPMPLNFISRSNWVPWTQSDDTDHKTLDYPKQYFVRTYVTNKRKEPGYLHSEQFW